MLGSMTKFGKTIFKVRVILIIAACTKISEIPNGICVTSVIVLLIILTYY